MSIGHIVVRVSSDHGSDRQRWGDLVGPHEATEDDDRSRPVATLRGRAGITET
jgi:hypothetical protein